MALVTAIKRCLHPYRGGPTRSHDNPTDIPSFATKHRVEKHLVSRSSSADGSDMSWLVVRPTGQLKGGITPDLVGKISATSCKIAMRKNKPLRYVGTDDIGYFAVQGFIHPDRWKEKFLSLAGWEGTYDEANDIFKTRIGRAMPATFGLPARLVLIMKDLVPISRR